jgi:hypothetical protein
VCYVLHVRVRACGCACVAACVCGVCVRDILFFAGAWVRVCECV